MFSETWTNVNPYSEETYESHEEDVVKKAAVLQGCIAPVSIVKISATSHWLQEWGWGWGYAI